MKKNPLRVTLELREPGVVELTLGDRVQLDRLSASHGRYLAERHGNLLGPGPRRCRSSPRRRHADAHG